MRIAINGLGRIGRLIFRRLINNPAFELVAVNDLMPAENLAYLLTYDSVYGTFAHPVSVNNKKLIVAGQEILALQQPNPAELPWRALNIDVVIECTGHFSTGPTAAMHLQAGARKVMLSTTGSNDIPLMIYGFNQHALTAAMDIISPGGCMTNCSVPILHLLQQVGIISAQIHFMHSYTSRQQLVDAPHKQFRRGRAAAESIIPVEIDLAESLDRLMPALSGKVAAISTRVPVANGALGDFTLQLSRETSVAALQQFFKQAASGNYHGVIDYTTEPLVSLDIKSNTHSSIIEGPLISAVGNHAKIFAWFDNEYGYTSRILDWLMYWKNMIK